MSSTTRVTPDNPYRKLDPWGARSTVPQVFTVQAAPAPMRRVFKPISEAPQAAVAPRAERLHLTPVAEPYDEPPPPRAETRPTPAPDLITARRAPFAGSAPLPASERARSFVGAAPLAQPELAKPERVKPVEAPVRPEPAAAAPSRLAPFARSDAAPRPTPAPAPEPQVKREEPVALRPVPLTAIAPPVGGFAPGRTSGGRRTGRPLPKGLLAASLLVLAGVAAIAAAVVLKPWAPHPGAVDALAAQSAKPPAPLTITPVADPFAANAATPPASTSPAPVTTAVASLTPRVGRPAPGAVSPALVSTTASVPPPAADAAPQPGAVQPAAAAAAPPKAAPTPIVVSLPPEMAAKPAAAQPEPVKIAPPPPKAASSETISTSHLPGDSVGPHQ